MILHGPRIINVSANHHCIFIYARVTHEFRHDTSKGNFFFDKLPNTKGGQLGHSHTSVRTRLPGNTHPRREFSIKTTTFIRSYLIYFYVYSHFYIGYVYIGLLFIVICDIHIYIYMIY